MLKKIVFGCISVFLVISTSTANADDLNFQLPEGVEVPSILRLAAAGDRDAMTTVTAWNQTTANNGSFFYLSPNNSIGFSPTDVIWQNTADVTYSKLDEIDCDRSTNDGYLRLSWHLQVVNDETMLQGGWRYGCTDMLNESTDDIRGIYVSSAPTFYPSGPQENVRRDQLESNGWTLCYADYYEGQEWPGEVLNEVLDGCVGDFLFFFGTSLDAQDNNYDFWSDIEDCRAQLASDLSAGREVSANTFQNCFFTGISSSNAAFVNAQLKSALAAAAYSGKTLEENDIIRSISLIADQLDLVQRLSTGKLVFASEFAAAGINLGALPTKTLDALKALPSAEIDTLEELLTQITKLA